MTAAVTLAAPERMNLLGLLLGGLLERRLARRPTRLRGDVVLGAGDMRVTARYADRLDPGFARLAREVKTLLDPDGILNPGKWVVSGSNR